MKHVLTKFLLPIVTMLVVAVLAIGGFTFAKNQGWLSPFGIESESRDSQVIHAVERTQEVSLLSLGIQGITEEERSRTAFGVRIPGSEEKTFLRYEFKGKLGIDGAAVEVTKTGEKSYLISVPEFIFIGYEEPAFDVAVEDDGVLSWATPDIDELKMVNEILDDDAQRAYIESNEDLLEEQTRVFYNSLISSIDPDIVTRFEFRSRSGIAP